MRRSIRLGFAVALALAPVAAACVGSDPDLPVTAPGTDAGGGTNNPDATGTTTGDSSESANDTGNDAGTPPGPTDNLLKNAQFDTSCDGWTPFGAVMTPNPAGHTAGGSCLVCGQGNAGWVLEQKHDFEHLEAGAFKTEVWLRGPDAGPIGSDISIDFELWDIGKGTQLVSLASSSVDPTADNWRGIQNTFEIGDAGGDNRQVKFQINCRNADKCNEGCALVDDAVLRR